VRDYGKLIWAVVGGVVYFLQAALLDGMTPEEYVGTVIAVVNAGLVWLATDTTINPQVKSWVGGLLAALIAAQMVINGGIDGKEWVGVVIALLTGAGVIVDPRRPVHPATQISHGVNQPRV
jgi:hypothetical protein